MRTRKTRGTRETPKIERETRERDQRRTIRRDRGETEKIEKEKREIKTEGESELPPLNATFLQSRTCIPSHIERAAIIVCFVVVLCGGTAVTTSPRSSGPATHDRDQVAAQHKNLLRYCWCVIFMSPCMVMYLFGFTFFCSVANLADCSGAVRVPLCVPRYGFI